MRILCVLAFVWLMASPAPAAILWDQSDFDHSINALVDQEFGDFPQYSSYMVMDVMTDPGGWLVQQMNTYFTRSSDAFAAVDQARLNVFHKTGVLPTGADNPVLQSVVPVRVYDMGDYYQVVTNEISVELAGSTEYWLGLTPIADFGTFGQEFHLAAPIIGEETAWRNPGASFGAGSAWQTVAAIDTLGQWVGNFDGAFSIPGIPEPGGLALLALGAAALPRRR